MSDFLAIEKKKKEKKRSIFYYVNNSFEIRLQRRTFDGDPNKYKDNRPQMFENPSECSHNILPYNIGIGKNVNG